MTKFFNIFKKPCFGSIFGPIFQFWDKKNFYGNSGSVTHNSYGFLAPCQNLEKTRDTIPRKRLDRRTDKVSI